MHTLEGDFEGTDVLQTLDGDFLPAGLFLVEVDRLHDASVNAIDAADSGEGEENLDNDFERFVHYFSVFIIFQTSDKVIKIIYEKQYIL